MRQKAYDAMVVYFGSEDLSDMPTSDNYKEMQDRLKVYRPQDVASLPTLLVKEKCVRIRTEKFLVQPTESLCVVGTKSRRAPKDLNADAFVKRTKTQLELVAATGKPEMVLAPYYVKVEKVKGE